MKAAQTANPPSYETVWAILQEVAKSQKETAKRQEETDREIKATQRENDRRQKEADQRQKEADRLLKESQRETDRLLKESKKETDRQIKDFNKRFGDFTNRFGEVVEYMIAPNLCEKFKEFGLIFPKANSGTIVSDHENNFHFEIDIMLENGDKAMLVEVKTKMTTEYIKYHIERI